jgi:hypothetical protein
VLALLIAVCTWPHTSVLAAPGLDPSWAVGISLAVARGLVFGRQVVFTYGPLGMVAVPQAVTAGTLLLGVAGAFAIQLVLAALLLNALRRQYPLLLAAVITLLGMSIIVAIDLPPMDEIAFGLVAFTLSRPTAEMRQATRTLALAGGALAAVAMLIRLNDGVAVTAIVAVGMLGGVSRLRYLAVGAITLVVTLTLAWLSLGQPLDALPDYVSTGLSVVRGYVDAMGYNGLGPPGGWYIVVVIVFAVGFAAAAWLALAGAAPRRGAALAGCVLLLHYFVAREMLVRFEPGHAAILSQLLAVPLLIPWSRPQRATGLAMAIGFAAASIAALGAYGYSVGDMFRPLGRESDFATYVKTVISPQSAIASGVANIRLGEAVPAAIVDELNNHCVDAEPVAISAIFAYPKWRWCPIGVLQSYTAYTPQLDNLDEAGFANARSGPDRVLRQVNSAIDGRNPTWDSPAAMLSMLCHFKEIGRGGQWQALARIPNRCGRPRLIASIHSGANDVAQIPAAPRGSVLVARIHGLQIHTRERLETLFVRAAERQLIINGGVTYRVPPDTLTDGLVLDVPPNADYAPPFNLNLDVHSIEATINLNGVPFTVDILSVPIRPA